MIESKNIYKENKNNKKKKKNILKKLKIIKIKELIFKSNKQYNNKKIIQEFLWNNWLFIKNLKMFHYQN